MWDDAAIRGLLAQHRGGITMASPLVGAWEIVSDDYQGVVVFSEKHYGDAFVFKDRDRFQGVGQRKPKKRKPTAR